MSSDLQPVVSAFDARLVDLLVASGRLGDESGRAVLARAVQESVPVAAILEREGVGEPASLLSWMSALSGLDAVNLEVSPPDPVAVAVIPRALQIAHGVLGYRHDGETLEIACCAPPAPEVLAAVREATGMMVGRCVLAVPSALARARDGAGAVDEGELPLAALLHPAARWRHPSVTLDLLAPLAEAPGAPKSPASEGGHRRPRLGLVGGTATTVPEITALLEHAVACGASDLHLAEDFPPALRVDGAITPIEYCDPLSGADIERLVFGVLSAEARDRLAADKELDAACALAGIGRFRVSCFHQRGALGAVFRLIPDEIPALASLGLPDVLQRIVSLQRGLVLVTGPTGSGKSTTLAALVDAINAERALHIMTVEDPIEYVHRHRRSIVNQREVGSDTRSFADSLRHVLRQDPDVILIGEMRDLETIATAITAAETGHLVLATLHTQDAPQSIDRMVDVFPTSQQDQVRVQLAGALEVVVTQQLVSAAAGVGRVAVAEVMWCTPAIRNLIRSGKTHQAYSLMQTGADLGMQTMDQALAAAVAGGRISEAQAHSCARDPGQLRDYLRPAGVAAR